MWRALCAALWLSGIASTAAIGAEAGSSRSPAGETPRNYAIWNQPMTLLTTLLGYTGLSLGANLPLGSSHDLILEVMPFREDANCDSYCGGEGVYAAVGVAFKMFGPREDSRDGFFVQPKFVAHVARHRFFNDFPRHETTTTSEFSVATGIDIGYRMTFGQLFIAPVLGASIGYANRLHDGTPRFIPLRVLGPNSGFDEPTIGFDLNIHLLRIGVAF